MTTNKVFNMIYDSSDYVRGEVIAEALSITRTAVNKHIKKLQAMDINIEATRRGYKYVSSDTLTLNTLSRKMSDNGLHHEVFLKIVDSTNNAVKSLFASGTTSSNEILYVAPIQTSGRGRLDREFISDEGGVYMTIGYSPQNISVTDSLKIVLLTGLCVAKVLDEYVPNVTIKWPNDVFVDDKKITGILLESVVNEFHVDKLILGIGINLSNTIPEKLNNIATSLKAYACNVNREDIIVKVAKALNTAIKEYEKTGFISFLDEYISRSRTIGNVVTVSSLSKKITGEAIGLSEEGYLLINNDGVIEKVIVGDVEV